MSHETDRTKGSPADSPSVEALVQHCLPSVQRWAHGKLPRGARGEFDTQDLVQEAALRMLRRVREFEPRHDQAVHAYMRQIVRNLVRDEARRLGRRPVFQEINEEVPCDQTGPLEFTISRERRAQYEKALRDVCPKDRQLLVARIEEEMKSRDIARIFGFGSTDAARMAVARAIKRLMRILNHLK